MKVILLRLRLATPCTENFCHLLGRILVDGSLLAFIFFDICIDRNMKRKKTNIRYVAEDKIWLTAGLCVFTINLTGCHPHLAERSQSILKSQPVLIVKCVKTANKTKP